ncbi:MULTISPECIES: hypothetical protein [unclassified Bradyrhizobium]|uniref:hypothetical protein n=1 Tax=unclassified Bradyrhizobium TaxID=2631580 RepID=UPI0028E47C34|nr:MULTISPECIES: hypothetical protein [unclassified Bradyrhizobium]
MAKGAGRASIAASREAPRGTDRKNRDRDQGEALINWSEEFPFLKDPDLPPEYKRILLDKALEERAQLALLPEKRAERQTSDRIERLKFWHNTPLVVTLVGTITIMVNGLVGYFQSQQTTVNSIAIKQLESTLEEAQKRSDAERERQLAKLKNDLQEGAAAADATRKATKEERDFAYKVIEKELAKSDDTRARAAVLLFLVRAGVLNSLNRGELERMALADLEGTKSPSEAVIPPTLGRRDVELPHYNLQPPPPSPGQTQSASRLLTLAVSEINRNVEETTSADRIADYWRAVNLDPMQMGQAPWSAAFISWLILKVDSPVKITPSAVNAQIWNDALRKKLTFLPGEKPALPGDIAVFLRVRAGSELSDARAGKSVFAPGQSGVIYSVDGSTFTSIEGNSADAVRLVTHGMTEQNLLGFIRLADAVP